MEKKERKVEKRENNVMERRDEKKLRSKRKINEGERKTEKQLEQEDSLKLWSKWSLLCE